MQFRVKNAKQLAPSFAFECGQGARENPPPSLPPVGEMKFANLRLARHLYLNTVAPSKDKVK